MSEGARRRVAQYVRMSTEHQRYSIAYQSAANAAYAVEHGHEIVRTYDDAGISGLELKRRLGLQTLLADVVGGKADFSAILVYDVSRWGRFQDTDESAHYEFICRAAGVEVIYTAEPFVNDGTLVSTLAKHIKRVMAAEYSRELSGRISRTQRGLGGEGYWMGGPALYGLSRWMIDASGRLARPLEPGEIKALRGERTILAPGAPDEVAVVQRIFHTFAVERRSPRSIVLELNDEGLHPPARPWTSLRIRLILRNEVYAGVMVIGKTVQTLRRVKKQPRRAWIRAEGAFEPIISPELFRMAQARFRRVHPRTTDQGLLEELRMVLARHGRLSADLIDADPDCHCSELFRRRFGSLMKAYELVGYEMPPQHRAMAATALTKRPREFGRGFPDLSDEELLARVRALLARSGKLSVNLMADTRGLPHIRTFRDRFGSLAQLYARVGYVPTPAQLGRMATYHGNG